MRVSTAVLASIAAAVVLSCSDSTGPVMHLLTNGGFESGDFTGWTVADTGNGSFFVTGDSVLPVSGDIVPAPVESLYTAVTDQTGATISILYRDVALPAGKRITFRAKIFVVNLDTNYVVAPTSGLRIDQGPNQQVRVDIVDPGAALTDVGSGVLMNVFQTLPGDPLTIGPKTISADLTAFAGQTVRLRFAEVDNDFYQHLGVDAVDVTSQ